MNVNEIPSELLLHIFSYLPQRDLFMSIDQVCELWKQLSMSPTLWKNVDYSSIYEDFSNAFGHLYKVQSSIKKLTITPGHIIDFFGFQRKLHFSNLKTLDVSDKLVVSEAFFDKIIQRCPKLENIKFISDSRFNMEHCLGKLSELELVEVDIGYFYGTRKLDENLLLFLTTQPRLKKLALRGWYTVSDSTIAHVLNNFPNITSFYMNNVNTTNAAFVTSANRLNLTELTLHCDLINDIALKHISKRLKHLKVVNVEQCRSITDRGLKSLVEHSPSLEELSFGNTYPLNSDELTNSVMLAVAERCSKLKTLSITGCRNINDDGIIQLARSCRGLTYLTLNGCTEMNDISLYAIGKHCTVLQHANFSNCFKISATSVYFVIRSCKALQSFILSFCTGISHILEFGEDMTGLVQNENIVKQMGNDNNLSNSKDVQCTPGYNRQDVQWTPGYTKHSHIKELILRSCTNISKETVLKLTSQCPDLIILNLSNCISENEDGEFLSQVFNNCKSLKTFKIYNKVVQRTDCEKVKKSLFRFR